MRRPADCCQTGGREGPRRLGGGDSMVSFWILRLALDISVADLSVAFPSAADLQEPVKKKKHRQ